MKDSRYDDLRLTSQLCFPLYVCAKEIVRRYKPLLDELDLTYTQYITMMVMWEYKNLSVKDLGEKLFLDSGTLTPVLKKLEKKGYISRERSKEDERVLIISITENGMFLREKASSIPPRMKKCLNICQDEFDDLYRLSYKLLSSMEEYEIV